MHKEVILKELDAFRICAIDIETTGLRVPSAKLDDFDEILQLAIVSEDYSLKVNEYFMPEYVNDWPDAYKVNQISKETVFDKPLFADRRNDIQSILDGFDLLICYNSDFDLPFLTNQGINLLGKQYLCMMKAFSQLRVHGTKTNKRLRRYSLKQCADYFGVKIAGMEHDALVDAKTVLACFKVMRKELGGLAERI